MNLTPEQALALQQRVARNRGARRKTGRQQTTVAPRPTGKTAMTAKEYRQRSRRLPKGLGYDLYLAIAEAGLPEPRTEYLFHPARRWRFDFAWPELGIAIEYEGLFADDEKNEENSGKSRHTTPAGYEGDCRKYSAARALGYFVVRLTALTPREQLITELREARDIQ